MCLRTTFGIKKKAVQFYRDSNNHCQFGFFSLYGQPRDSLCSIQQWNSPSEETALLQEHISGRWDGNK